MKKFTRLICIVAIMAVMSSLNAPAIAASKKTTKDPTVYYVIETSEKYHKNTKCRSLKKTAKKDIVEVKLSECPKELEACKICKPQKR